MNTQAQTKNVDALAEPSDSLASILPMELVLAIVEAAILQHRVDNISWCLKLSLVCHAFRASVLPLAYEFHFLDVSESQAGEFIGWDGRTRKYSQTAFLSWLLHDPTAPPRRHIKHLIFSVNEHYVHRDMPWDGPQAGDTASKSRWPIEQLTSRDYPNAWNLYCAGIRPQKSRLLELMPYDYEEVVPVDIFTYLIEPTPLGSHSHIRTDEPVKSENGTFIDEILQERVTRRERFLTKRERAASATAAGTEAVTTVLTIHLHVGDYLHHFPDQFLEALLAVLVQRTDVEVVLACNVDYKIIGRTLAEFIHAAALPADAVKTRLRISHKAWMPRKAAEDLFVALVKAELRGDDPWDGGQVI